RCSRVKSGSTRGATCDGRSRGRRSYAAGMRLPRVAILVSTLVAWIVPSGLAMWLDVERFVHPYLAAPAPGDYEREPSFQRLFFVIRFGWLLGLVLVVVLAVQVGLLRRIEPARADRVP